MTDAPVKNPFRQAMAWLHTWAGLLLGWVLYFMFVTGTLGYLDTEIDRWMNPELPVSQRGLPAQEVAQRSLAYLQTRAPAAESWVISLPLTRNEPYPRVFWRGGAQPDGLGSGEQMLDPLTGTALFGRETGGGQTLYRMHWKLHYLPEAVTDWIVGVASLFMLIALVTGVIVHKKIFADFFTFRPGKGQRSWLDAHNMVSVLSLPFQLMITYSGLIFMMFVYLPLIIAAWYGAGEKPRQTFFDEVFETPAQSAASGRPAPLASLSSVLGEAERRWNGAPVASLEIRHPGDAQARILVRGDFAAGALRAADLLVFDGVSGELIAEQPALRSTSKAFRDLMLGLHEGLFAAPLLRAFYLLFGLLGALMIATGLVLWTTKRRQRLEAADHGHLGLRLTERLNVATLIGLPVAIAGYFWANRLLPLTLDERAAWELHCLFITWLLLFLHAALRPREAAWREQSWAAALAFGLLPGLNALTSSRHLGHSLVQGDWIMAGIDLGLLAMGIAFALLALHLRRRSRQARKQQFWPAPSRTSADC